MNAKLPTQRGFTLVELMIAMALGLFLVGAAIRVVMVNQRTFRVAENQARLQENARTAFELLAHDIRSAGGNPCGANQVQTNDLIGSPGLWWANWAGGSIQGFENSQAGDAAQNIVPVGGGVQQRQANTDALIVMSANNGDGIVAAQHDTITAPPNFRITSAQHGLTRGDIVMVCDESNAAIFQVTNLALNTTTIEYAAGGAGVPAGAPGNIAANLGGYVFPNGAFIARLHSAFWYVGPNNRGSSSLYRLTFTGRLPFATEEIVEGVTDLQLQYVERNAGIISPPAPAPAPLSNWINANLVTQWAFAPAQTRVEGINIALTLQSRDAIGVAANGTAQRLTTILNETIYLRNREYN